VTASTRPASARWPLRTVPGELVRRYRDEGWWRDESLGDVVARGLRNAGDNEFRVHSAVRPWQGTFADVDRAARSLASALQSRGVGPGDVVVFQLPNWVEAAITFWASAFLGAVVVPIVHFYGPKEVRYVLDVTRPSVIVTPEQFGFNDYLANYAEAADDHPDATWLVVGASSTLPARATRFEDRIGDDPLSAPLPVDPTSPALVGFTSGTTRDPKGVVHSHQTIAFETRQLDANYPHGPPPVTGTPVGHFIGMLAAFLLPLATAVPVNLVDVWDPGVVLRLMTEHGLSFHGGATYFLTSLLDHPDFEPEHLALMPSCGLGGSSVPEAVTRRAEELGIKVFRSYGSTEHPSITGSPRTDPAEKRLGTDGRPLLGVEVRLDADGQILSRGPDCFLGYTSGELTDAAFDDEGWYRTGDVGTLDDDGYLTIVDRISDVIIRGGENISAVEVEDLLMQIDEIAEVSVVSEPDDRLGERAAAVVRVHPDATAPTLAAMQQHLATTGLARQKWPESLYVVDDLPRTPSGKVQKFVLRQGLRRGEARG